MADSNGNGNGNGAVKQSNINRRGGWQPGVSGNPKGRPKKAEALSHFLKKGLASRPPGERKTYRELIAQRLLSIAACAEEDGDAIRAARELRQATEGDTVHYGEIETHGWEVSTDGDAVQPDPVPPVLPTGRFP